MLNAPNPAVNGHALALTAAGELPVLASLAAANACGEALDLRPLSATIAIIYTQGLSIKHDDKIHRGHCQV